MGTGSRRFNTAIDRYFSTSENLREIDEAKTANIRSGEVYDIEKKTADLKLKKAQIEGGMTDIDYKIHKSRMDDYFKSQKAIQDGKAAQISVAEQSEMKANKSAQQEAANIAKTDPEVNGQIVQGYKARILEPVYKGGHYRMQEKRVVQPTASEKIIGSLDVGGITDNKGELTEFVDREDAEKYATSKLGVRWKSKFPDAVSALDRRYGPKDLPSNIKDTQTALDYLVEEIGMEKEAAIDWLKEKYLNK